MKQFIVLLTVCVVCNFSIAQLNIDSIGHLDLNTIHDQGLNDIWGYVDEFDNEYAIVGGTKGTSVVDISAPSIPTEVFFEPGMESIWRDVETFGDYAYVTTEALNGLLIIDLSPLPASNSLTTSYYFGPTGMEWQSAHNLYIDSSGYCYIFGANRGNGGVIILDVFTDPMNPIEVGVFDDWYVQDGFADNDTLYLGHIYEGWMSVVDVTNRANPILLGTQTTPSNFAHNVWTSDGHYAFTTDEVSGGFIGAYDISDASNIIEIDRVQSSPGKGVIPHNTHVYQNYLVTSYYSDGVTIHDISRPNNLIEVGNYDTYPDQTTSYDGCWGVFPFFPSGLIVASDRTEGLFVLSPNYVQACYLEGNVIDANTTFAIGQVEVVIENDDQTELTSLLGDYETGIASAGSYNVTFSKVGYFPQTISVNLVQASVVNLDIALVPIPPYAFDVVVLEEGTNTPIIGADIRLEADLLIHDGVSNGIGEENFTLYYQESYLVSVGKWGYITSCEDVIIDNMTGSITIHLSKGFYDDFQFDFGWSSTGSASSGLFERGIPFGTSSGSNPGVDGDDCGLYCYVTGNAPSLDPDTNPINNGTCILKSPIMDLTSYVDPFVNFDRYFYNEHGPMPPPDDTLKVFVDNGIESVLIDTIGYDPSTFFQWYSITKRIQDYITITATMQFTFFVSDFGPSFNITEAAIDHFYIAEANELSVEDLTTRFSIYPNPAQNVLKVSGIMAQTHFSLVNLNGEIIIEGEFKEGINSVDVSFVSDGLYVLFVENKGYKIAISN